MPFPKTILVTGADGLIGRHALLPLLRLGFEVHAIQRKPAKPEIPMTADIHWHRGDLLSPEDRHRLIQDIRPTYLLHFAWYAEHGKFWNSAVNLQWVKASLDLLELFAQAGGKRFVGAGSCAEYDWSQTSEPLSEEKTPLMPATLYGAAKASTFITAKAYAATQKLSFAWGRIFLVFGPGEYRERIIPALIRAHLFEPSLDCSQGTQLRDFLSSRDIAEAFVSLCASEAQGAVNIGSGLPTTIRGLSETLALLAGRKADIRFGAFFDPSPQQLLPDLDRLFHEVGWTPPPSLDPSLAQALAWWRDQP